MRPSIIAIILTAALAVAPARALGAHTTEGPIAGRVQDALGRPLAGVELELQSAAGKAIAHSISSATGAFSFRKVVAGTYAIVARRNGFKPATAIMTVAVGNTTVVKISMESERALNLPVIAARLNQTRNLLSPETGSSVYRFSQKNIHELPQGDNTPINEVLVQAPGVSQDAYGQGQGQIHIHGLNGGGIQYRLNGIFLPEAVTSFGQLLSPYFINRISVIENFMPPVRLSE